MSSLERIISMKVDLSGLRGNSFFLLSPNNAWRQLAFFVAFHPYMLKLMYLLITMNAISMAIVSPIDDQSSTLVKIVQLQDWVVVGFFALEMLLKMCAIGAFIGKYSYWNISRWYRLDFTVVCGSILGIALETRGVSAFRAFRAFRIFRAIKYFSGFRDIMDSLKSGLSLVADNSAFMGFFFLVFGVMSVEFFKNSLSRWCVMEADYALGVYEDPIKIRACKSQSLASGKVERGNCPEHMVCIKFGNDRYKNGKANFDDVFHSIVLIWQISTLSGWTEHAYHLQEAESSLLPAVYCAVLIFILNFIVVNLFVAVVGAVFSRVRESDCLEHPSMFLLSYDGQQAFEETRRSRLNQTINWGLVGEDLNDQCTSWGKNSLLLHSIDKKKEQKTSPWELLRHQLVPIFYSRKLLIVVSCLTLANVLLKATYTSESSDSHIQLLFIVDLSFTSLFAVEMMLRFLITGRSSVAVFFRSSWDMFDTVILVLSILLLITKGTSLSFFRLRVLQLAFYFEGLKPAGELFHRSVAGIPGSISIVLFISLSFFVFGVAGLQFFAGKMNSEDGTRMRLHFDHFFSGQLLLFQVMSGDTWEEYMRGAWRGTGPFGIVFVVAFYVYSVWVLLNLFTAVVLENFDREDAIKYLEQIQQYHDMSKEHRISANTRVGRRESIMTTIKGVVWKFFTLPEAIKKQHEQEMQDYSLAHELSSVLEKGSRHTLTALLTNMNSLEMDETDGVKNTEASHLEVGRGAISEIAWNASVSMIAQREARHEYYVSKNHATRQVNTGFEATDDQNKFHLHLPCHNLIRESDIAQERIASESDEIVRSFFFFDLQSSIRMFLRWMVTHKNYELFMVLCIVLSTISLGLDNPSEATAALESESSTTFTYRALRLLDWVWLGIFGQEVLSNCIAFGVYASPWSTKKGYLNNLWNVLDTVLLISMLVTIALPRFKIIQVFRTLRPIRVLRKVQSLHIVVSAIWGALPATFTIAAGIVLLFVLLGIVGMSFFAGKLNYCNNTTATGQFNCSGLYVSDTGVLMHTVWMEADQNFDSISASIQTLIEVTSLASWTTPMFATMDITGKGLQPEFMSSPMNCVYFLVVVMICSFYLVNVFVAVILDRIYQEMGISLMTEEQRAWSDFQKTVQLYESIMHGAKPPDFSSSSTRLVLYHLVSHPMFDPFILCLITINIAFMASQHTNQPTWWTDVLLIADYIFLGCYIIEMLIKIIAYGGYKNYFKNKWNSFDAFVVIGSIVSLILKSRQEGDAATVGVVRMLRIARVFKLMTATTGVKFLFKTLIISLPAIFNIILLALILMMIYVVFGKQIFGGVKYQSTLNMHANFRTTETGMWTIFRVLTLDNWHYISHDAMVQPPLCTQRGGDDWHDDCGSPLVARLYFYSFYLIGVYIFINLILAIILDNFGHIFSENSFCLTEDSVIEFDVLWCEEDTACRGELPRYKIKYLLEALHVRGNPLGCDIHALTGYASKKRFDFIMHTLSDLSVERVRNDGKPADVTVRWRDVLNIVALTYIRFFHTNCLNYSHNQAWKAEKLSVEQLLAGKKILAWILSHKTMKELEREFGSRVFVIKRIKEFLYWKKQTEVALARGKRPPPPPAEKYANLSAEQLALQGKEQKDGSRPGAKDNSRPVTKESSRQVTRETSRPVTRETSRPGTRDTSRPGTRDTSRPGTRDTLRPGTREASRPNTAQVHQELGNSSDESPS